jgi:N-acetylmuramoyl-L-alanine amidase
MGDAARTRLVRTSLRRGAWVLLLLFLAACAQPRSVPTAPVTTTSSAVTAADDAQQLAAIPPEPPMPAYDATPAERKCLALTVYYEARAESLEGQQAVAAVVLNRVRDGKFPNNICAVVHEGGGQRSCQFSWYCDGRSDKPRDGDAWRQAVAVADAAIDGEITDPTDGALYFHSTGVKPKWRKKLTKTAAIDNHIFYR